MKRMTCWALGALAAGVAFAAPPAPPALARDMVFLSIQLRPINQAQKVWGVLLNGAPKTGHIVHEPPQFAVRIKAEQKASWVISVMGALRGELQPLGSAGSLAPIDGPILLGFRGEDALLTDVGAGVPFQVRVAEPIGSHLLLTGHIGEDLARIVAPPDARGLALDTNRIVWLRPAIGPQPSRSLRTC